MLTITNLTCRMGARTLLEKANLTVRDGWKIGVVGPNGIGKSTLFKVIAGERQADGGEVTVAQGRRLGMVRQDLPDSDTALLDIVLEADTERSRLLADAETVTDPDAMGEIYDRLEQIGAYAAPARAASILAGLGFTEEQMQQPITAFSGGWRMRVALAAALFVQPEILLLDEPTNHLDIEAIMWLEDYLAKYPHTLMIISHDRELLNTCTDHIAHIDNQQLVLYTGNYDTFEKERAEKLNLQQKMFEKQQAQRAHMQAFVDRFRAKASKARQAQSRLKALEKMDLVSEVMAARSIHFRFPQPDQMPPPLMTIDHVDVGYEANKPILRRIHERVDMDDRIALLGANGNGKSTLIKLIAGKLQPQQGEVGKSGKLRIGYFAQHQADELDVENTPFQEMRRLMLGQAESNIRAKLGQFGFNKNLADSTIKTLSGGEKARLLFALMTHHAPHLLLLDEPTNHLDMDAREALVRALNDYEGAVVIVSHDPTMLERVADRLWLVEGGQVHPFDGDLAAYRKHVLESRRRDKRAEKKAAPVVEEKPDLKPEPKPQSNRDQEARKRRQYPDLYKRIQQTEKQMTQLQERKKTIEAQMADPAFYADTAKMQDVQFDYGRLLRELGSAEEAWLDAQDQFEKAPL